VAKSRGRKQRVKTIIKIDSSTPTTSNAPAHPNVPGSSASQTRGCLHLFRPHPKKICRKSELSEFIVANQRSTAESQASFGELLVSFGEFKLTSSEFDSPHASSGHSQPVPGLRAHNPANLGPWKPSKTKHCCALDSTFSTFRGARNLPFGRPRLAHFAHFAHFQKRENPSKTANCS